MSISTRVVPRFPARVSGADGVAVEKENGAFTVKQDWGALAEDLALPNTADTYFGIWKQSGDTYTRVSADTLLPYVASGIVTLNITRAQIATTKIPLNSFAVAGHTTAGDIGAGAVYVRGTSSGTMAVQDLNGTWWNLAIQPVMNIGWFGGVAGNSSATTSAIATAETAMATNGGVLVFPGGGWTFTYTNPNPKVIRRFEGENDDAVMGSVFTFNPHIAECVYLDGPHTTRRHSARGLMVKVKGSGTDLSGTGDNGFEIDIQKENWYSATPAATGEMAGLTINGRQAGPNTGPQNSFSGIGIDALTVDGSGFCCMEESACTWIDTYANGGGQLYRIVMQRGVLNSRTGTRIGQVLNAPVGTMETAMQFQTEGTGRWTDLIRSTIASIGSWIQFKVSDLGKLTWRQANDDAKTVTLEGDSNGAVVIKKLDGTSLFKVGQSGYASTYGAIGVRAEATGDSTSYIDFFSDSSGSFTTRLSRAAGANGIFKIGQTGSGALQISQDGTGALQFFSNGGITFNGQAISYLSRGNTASRPSGLGSTTNVGFRYFDQTLGKPIFWNGTGWIDAAGTSV